MNIPIKINDKKYTVKPALEMTVVEYVKFEALKVKDVPSYISMMTGIKMKDAFFAVMSPAIENAIGTVPDIRKVKKPKRSDIDYTKSIDTVGQRHQIEDANLSGARLLVLTLAVSQARSMNIDDVYKLRDKYMSEPFIEILPAAFFFFNRLRRGRNKGVSYLKKLVASTETRL